MIEIEKCQTVLRNFIFGHAFIFGAILEVVHKGQAQQLTLEDFFFKMEKPEKDLDFFCLGFVFLNNFFT